jgi:hypothetical protein
MLSPFLGSSIPRKKKREQRVILENAQIRRKGLSSKPKIFDSTSLLPLGNVRRGFFLVRFANVPFQIIISGVALSAHPAREILFLGMMRKVTIQRFLIVKTRIAARKGTGNATLVFRDVYLLMVSASSLVS